MSTKYHVGGRTAWQHRHDVRLTDHMLERWDERAPVDSVAPETAYEQSWDVTEIAGEFGSDNHDAARLYAGDAYDQRYWLIMPIAEVDEGLDQVTTVLTWSMIHNRHVRAYLRSIAQSRCMGPTQDSV